MRRAFIGAVLVAACGFAVVVTVAGASSGGSTASGIFSASSQRLSGCHRNVPALIRDGFPEPPLRYSRNGSRDDATRLGQRGSHQPPARGHDELRRQLPLAGARDLRRDTLIVHLVNDLPQPTNLHTHGFHVSPSGHSDNIFVHIDPGHTFTYVYHMPYDNDPGSYWYHPHLHMFVEGQIFAGMAGPIVVEGGLDRDPALRTFGQRWIFLTQTQVKDGKTVPASKASGPDSPIYVNGDLNPSLRIRPGQIQRWRIFNANADRLVELRLAGQPFRVLARDGNTLVRPLVVRDLLIGPGSRADVLVRGGGRGNYTLKALPFEQFPGANDVKKGGWVPNQTLLTVRSRGRRMNDRFPAGTLPVPPWHPDLRGHRIDRSRTIVFSEMNTDPTNTNFLINGQMFDPNHTLVTMKLGALERWTLVNTNDEWHTFHIHINPFQVLSIAGKRVPYVDYQDNVAMPAHQKVVLVHPTDFTGKFVFHCHVTFHEDHGMIGRRPSRSEADGRPGPRVDGQADHRGSFVGAGSTAVPAMLTAQQFLFYCHLHRQLSPMLQFCAPSALHLQPA